MMKDLEEEEEEGMHMSGTKVTKLSYAEDILILAE